MDEKSLIFGPSDSIEDLIMELIKKIHRWLESRKNQKNLKLNLIIDGNLLNINVHDVKILLKILNECSEQKK
ncbi:MAG: hypothetical protein P8X91_10790 [Candidatus Bathyarchaeota archaeon]